MTPPTRADRMVLLAALWGLCLIGLAARGWVATRVYPMTAGDPLYSYTYRATLIAAGRWEGVELMWHPPGYPLVLAGVSAATGGLLPPYAAGVLVSLGCYVGLFWLIDRLVARRARYAGTRLVAGSFIALYETLLVWAVGPLTEPPYLLLLYGAVSILDRERIGRWAALAAGALLGAGVTLRFEAVAPTAGLGLYVAWHGYQRGGWRGAAGAGAAFAAGWLATAGWLAVRVEYVLACSVGQVPGYTFPPARGPAGLAARAAECVYHAATVWLPFALLVPYWVLVGAGLTHRARGAGRPVLHPLLLAVVVPTLVAVTWTIMHKRTASFLLPAAAVWVALGVEVLARRWGGGPRARGFVFALVVAANVAQAGRVAVSVRKADPPREAPGCVAADVLGDTGADPGSVWAFGSEPDIYALRGWPVVYPFFAVGQGYNQAYTDHAGNPSGFVGQLRDRGFRYLTFALAPAAAGTEPGEPQPFSGVAPTPTRADLERIAHDPGRYGLEQVGDRPALGGRTWVYVYRLR